MLESYLCKTLCMQGPIFIHVKVFLNLFLFEFTMNTVKGLINMMFIFIDTLGFEKVCHNFFEYFRVCHFLYINITHISLSVIS